MILWNINKAIVGKYHINRGCCTAVHWIVALAFENISEQSISLVIHTWKRLTSNLSLDCLCIRHVWLIPRVWPSLSPALAVCVRAEPKHGFEVLLKCLESSASLSEPKLGFHIKPDYIFRKHWLVISRVNLACVNEIPRSLWKDSLNS